MHTAASTLLMDRLWFLITPSLVGWRRLAALTERETVRSYQLQWVSKFCSIALPPRPLAREEWSENKAFCEYCQIATLCSFVSLALAVPEVVTAIRTLLGLPEEDTEASSSWW